MKNFFNEFPRGSEDEKSTRDYLEGLIANGEVTIRDVLVFFNYACGAYKEASRVIGSSDARINIEFNYAARAFASYLSAEQEDEKKLALLDAFQASRHIINDSLDLVLGEIERLLRDSREINLDMTISQYIDEFETLYKNKENIHSIVSESRRKRGKFRYQAYLEMIYGDPYKDLTKFLEKINQAIFKLGANAKKIRSQNRTQLWLVTFTTILAIAGFIGLLFPKKFEAAGESLIKTVPQINISTTPKNP